MKKFEKIAAWVSTIATMIAVVAWFICMEEVTHDFRFTAAFHNEGNFIVNWTGIIIHFWQISFSYRVWLICSALSFIHPTMWAVWRFMLSPLFLVVPIVSWNTEEVMTLTLLTWFVVVPFILVMGIVGLPLVIRGAYKSINGMSLEKSRRSAVLCGTMSLALALCVVVFTVDSFNRYEESKTEKELSVQRERAAEYAKYAQYAFDVKTSQKLKVSCEPVEGGHNIVATDAAGNEIARVFTDNTQYNSVCHFHDVWIPVTVQVQSDYIEWSRDGKVFCSVMKSTFDWI